MHTHSYERMRTVAEKLASVVESKDAELAALTQREDALSTELRQLQQDTGYYTQRIEQLEGVIWEYVLPISHCSCNNHPYPCHRAIRICIDCAHTDAVHCALR